jgi:hypothetical protein
MGHVKLELDLIIRSSMPGYSGGGDSKSDHVRIELVHSRDSVHCLQFQMSKMCRKSFDFLKHYKMRRQLDVKRQHENPRCRDFSRELKNSWPAFRRCGYSIRLTF